MVSKNNIQHKMEDDAKRVPHYGLRKLGIGVASVLLGTTLYFGNAQAVRADATNNAGTSETETEKQTTTPNMSNGTKVTLSDDSKVTNASNETSESNNGNTDQSDITTTKSNNESTQNSIGKVQDNGQKSANSITQKIDTDNVNNASKAIHYSKLSVNNTTGPNVTTEVTSDTTDQTIDIYYTANNQTAHINYIDDAGKIVYTTAITGKTGETVNLSLTVPDKYQLADGQQLPTTYTFTAGSGDVTIYLAHKVVQREATVDVKLVMMTGVTGKGADYTMGVIPQTYWRQLVDKYGDRIKTASVGPDFFLETWPSVEVGTLTGHVNYDLVDNKVVSFGDDWTTLNLGGRTYQLPNGTDVVNGMMNDSDDDWGKSFRESFLADNPNVDPDYATRPWHGYLSVNATNGSDFLAQENFLGLQGGLAGNESNALAKVNGDQAATAVEIANKTIDVSLLNHFDASPLDFSEQDGRLQRILPVPVVGAYIPYVEKIATRIINVTTPDGKTKTVKQTATLAKPVDPREDAHADWTTGEWTSYDVPTIPGYTASQPNVAKETVTGATKDQTVNITYTANPQTATVVYQTEDGTPVHTTMVKGQTGQTVKVSNEVPAGWKIINGQVPSEITFGADGHEPVVITVAHQHVTVDPDHPQNNGTKLPDNPAKTFEGVEANDLNKTITRTIKVTTPDGQIKTIAQTAKLTRTADVDEVTGGVKYGEWSTGQWDAYEIPSLKGYTASQSSVAATPVNENTKDQTVEVSYMPNKQSTIVKYVDDKGQVVHTTTVDGATDQTVKVSNEVPAGWKIINGQVPNEITFGADGHEPVVITVAHQHVTVDPDHPQNNGTKLPDNPAKTFSGVEANDLNKNITRTIKVTTPDGQIKTIAQTAKLTRNADVDEVTGEVTYGKWTTGKWSNYDVSTVPGYTASQNEVPATEVTSDTTDQTIDIYYTANNQTTHINYVDDAGKAVHTTIITGKTGETVKVPNEVPAGWTITKGEVPSEISFGPNGHADETITIGHLHVTVDPDHPQNNGTKLPDNPAKTFEGVEVNDLNKTITRTIKVTTPDGKTTTIKQTAKLTRTANVDEVTGEVTYGKWTTGEWAAYDVSSVAGYTPSQATVAKESVTATSKDTTVVITYLPMQHQISVEYVDDDDHGKIVKTNQVPGKTDQTITVTPSAPANYDLVDNDNRTYTVTSDDAQAVQIHVKHHQVTTSETKTVTRTINVHTPHDGTKVVKQTAELTRKVTIDQVTGNKTYGDWTTAEWDRYAVPAIAGYVPSVEQVAQQVVNGITTDQVIDVTYSSGEHTTHINYVDGDGNIVHMTTIKGQTDGTVQVPNETPAGWTVVGEPVPTELAFGPDGHSDVTVTVDHQHVTVTPDQPKVPTDKLPDNPAKTYPNGVGNDNLNKTITRTIKIVMPDGQTKTVAQTAHLTRTADVDEVTGEVTYGKWTTGEWSNYDVPTVPGYTPSQSEVPAQTVSFGDNDIVKTVTYKANGQKLKVAFIDDTTGKTLNTIEKTGLSDTDSGYNTKADISDYAAKHYELVSDGTNGQNLVFDHDDSKDQHYEVHLTHHKSDTSRQSIVNETVHYVYENSKQAADDYAAKPIVFTQTGVKDLVTGDTDWNGQWTSDQEFKAVDSPEITGYTPSQKTVDAIKVSHDTSDIKRVVTYVANNQVAKITYIDDVTGKVLATDEVSGKFGSRVDYNALARINSFEKQGYQLKTNGFDQPSYQADDTKNQFEIRLIHQLNKTSRESTVTRTISYVDSITGLTLHQPTIQTLKFIEDGVTDLVTNETTWQTASRQQFVSVKVPEIKGYASELSVVEPAEVGLGDANIETTVKYKKLDVTNTISYVDSQGKVIKTDTVSGQSGTEIKLDVPSGYHLVDNQTKVTISENNSTQTVKITKDNSANKIARHLPQTGNQRETGLVALGFAAGLLGLVVLRKKRN